MNSDKINPGKLALITGASSGLGIALAEDLARRGYDLILTARSAAPMQALAARLRQSHSIAVTVETADLSQPGSVQSLATRLNGQGLQPTMLIANAAFGLNAAFVTHDADRLNAMLHLNIVSLAELAHLYGGRMKAAGAGHIMFVASIAAFQATPLLGAYGASKAFVLSLGESLHVELAPTVGVTVLCPGYMETGFGAVAGFEPDGMARRTALPAGKVATIGVDAMLRGQPVVVAGAANKALVGLARHIPRMTAARIAYRASGGAAHKA
ncbi:SDR family NAD(P)-dependent oxidoreductase [Acidisoma cellulosilytica]|uniref:SDR family NAD(P)-dependent oxidoreductase n=1 Tax=Acidisoma cellulosilyticum TaxID=2802395 RepID=A0A963Z737_9PROT|nr:SDR family NAD(P)-dependent oxidoreductase [Acidisoma cellulosilyticum]MCB8883325.1 SDR family NAD(P)-dependent oxidoreductase [Acidisoma cellulosilyticum]